MCRPPPEGSAGPAATAPSGSTWTGASTWTGDRRKIRTAESPRRDGSRSGRHHARRLSARLNECSKFSKFPRMSVLGKLSGAQEDVGEHYMQLPRSFCVLIRLEVYEHTNNTELEVCEQHRAVYGYGSHM